MLSPNASGRVVIGSCHMKSQECYMPCCTCDVVTMRCNNKYRKWTYWKSITMYYTPEQRNAKCYNWMDLPRFNHEGNQLQSQP